MLVPSKRSTTISSATWRHPNCCVAKEMVDFPDPDFPENASTPCGHAVAPAWNACHPRACKTIGWSRRPNVARRVCCNTLAAGHTQTSWGNLVEKAKTPKPFHSIQWKPSRENARPKGAPFSSSHRLTSRPLEGGGVPPATNLSLKGPTSNSPNLSRPRAFRLVLAA